MNLIGGEQVIEEILFDRQTRDLIKARAVLQHLDRTDKGTQQRVLYELARAEDEFAIPALALFLVEQPALAKAFPTVHELLLSKVLVSPEVSVKLLHESRGPERRILIDAVGEIRLEEAVPALIGLLSSECDEPVLCAAINALGAIGAPEATTAVSEFLYSGSREFTTAAIAALGRIASPAAIRYLAEGLRSRSAHLRGAAKTKLIEIGREAIPILLENLRHEDPDVLIHTLNVLGAIGDAAAVGPIRELLRDEPSDANVRFAAYESLGMIPMGKTAYILAAGVTDPAEHVRSAAAVAIDRNFNTILATGLRNLMEGRGGEAEKIAATIINAQADSIFLDLLADEFFRRFAIYYLSNGAHKDINEHFAQLLVAKKECELAARIRGGVPTEAQKLKVVAVDDSRMILKIYRSTLHNLGYEPVLFDSPAAAIAYAQKTKPDVVLTDLNMPDITGVGLARQIRRWYDHKALPIIMVTTQDEAEDNAEAYEAGVNAILRKPFTGEQIRQAISRFLPAAA